jgi:hypothetical protein
MPPCVGAWKCEVITSDEAANGEKALFSGLFLFPYCGTKPKDSQDITSQG